MCLPHKDVTALRTRLREKERVSMKEKVRQNARGREFTTRKLSLPDAYGTVERPTAIPAARKFPSRPVEKGTPGKDR